MKCGSIGLVSLIAELWYIYWRRTHSSVWVRPPARRERSLSLSKHEQKLIACPWRQRRIPVIVQVEHSSRRGIDNVLIGATLDLAVIKKTLYILSD